MTMDCATPGKLMVWLNVSAAVEEQNSSNNATRDATEQGNLPGFSIRRLQLAGMSCLKMGGLACLPERWGGVNNKLLRGHRLYDPSRPREAKSNRKVPRLRAHFACGAVALRSG